MEKERAATRSTRNPSPRSRPRRDVKGMAARRRRAARMFDRGATQAEVARALQVSRQSASRWYAAWRADGGKVLGSPGRLGRPPRLGAPELRAVEQALLKGPKAAGYPTELWTLERVAQVIERVTGISYHRGHVWKILRGMGWSLQRPARRAVERDDRAVRRWRRDRWPRVKKTPADVGRSSSSRTSRASR